MYNKTVFNLLKRVLGIERGRFFPVAGAPLSDTVNEFLQSVNIPIVYGYGLSETTATVCFYPEIGFQFGSIGEVMPDVQVRIDPENSEILVKGKTVMSGYYNKRLRKMVIFVQEMPEGWKGTRCSLLNVSRTYIRHRTANTSLRKRLKWL